MIVEKLYSLPSTCFKTLALSTMVCECREDKSVEVAHVVWCVQGVQG